MAKSFKDYRKGKSPCSKAGGTAEEMGRDAGKPAYKKYIRRPVGVVLNLECSCTHDLPVAQDQATVLVNTPNRGDEKVLFLF